LLEEKLIQKPTMHWVDALNDKGIPSGDIYGLEKALLQPQSEHRQVIATVKEEGIGDIKLFNLTAKFSKTPAKIDAPPPRLSAHTGDILRGLGYKEEEVKALKEKGAI
jgi:crotonobetainyl-CoA:carnitine CoA-transferase CaiB-like acyl-CoA transferase